MSEKEGQRQIVVKCEKIKHFSDIQQLLSAATDFKKYFEFLLQIYRIDVSLKGLWNDATIGFLYESLFSEKNINST